MVFYDAGTRWAVLPTAQKSIVPVEDADLIVT